MIVHIPHPMTGDPFTKTMVVDPSETVDPTSPPFVTNPAGSKPYHGHPLLEETRVGGWCFGVVTDPFEPDSDSGCSIGDAFVEAPDGSRAGLVWVVADEAHFGVVAEPDSDRWGVYFFTVSHPIADMEQLVEAFTPMVAALRQLHGEAINDAARTAAADGGSWPDLEEHLAALHQIGMNGRPGEWRRGLVALFFVEMETSETHGAMAKGASVVAEVLRLGIVAWPKTDLVCISEGPTPRTTLITDRFARTMSSSVAKRNWRGQTVSWSPVASETDPTLVDLVRRCLRSDKRSPEIALATLTSMENVGLFDS